eukprot:TRINITY_DN725_c0_g1_i1.p1 TRINITY_DN725_c0_g1~~TRINITY_DN725_c0_g1_i1.p1  ORF type:complete len:176 (+),score=24.47 TRINITY_DN725_c0_g1_i1:397-924(+)
MDNDCRSRRRWIMVFFYPTASDLFVNLRRLYHGLRPHFSGYGYGTLESFISQNMKSKIASIDGSFINLNLFPKGTWEIKIKPKNRRSKKNKPRKMVDSPPLVTQESNNEIYDETSRDSVDFLNNTDIICSDPEETIPSSVPEENQLMELTMSKRKDSPPSKSQGPSPKKSSQNSS